MKEVSLKQANVWAHKIMQETLSRKKENNDSFDAMLFIESKEVRKVLPVIISSLNQRHEKGIEDPSSSRHYNDTLTSLLKSMRQAYGEAENPIQTIINDISNENVKNDYRKLNEFANKLNAEERERTNKTNEVVLGR